MELPLPMGRYGDPWPSSGERGDSNIAWKSHDLYSEYIQVMHDRNGLCLCDMARRRLACHSDDARYYRGYM